MLQRKARALYARAAKIETEVALDVSPKMMRTRSVLAVSATSLWMKAGEREKAHGTAYHFLNEEGLTEHGRAELRLLLEEAKDD